MRTNSLTLVTAAVISVATAVCGDVRRADAVDPLLTRVTRTPDGEQSLAISGGYVLLDGNRLLMGAGRGFDPAAVTTDVWIRDLSTGAMTLVTVGPGGEPVSAGEGAWPGVTRDGRYVALHVDFANPSSGYDLDVYRRDTVAGTTTLLSAATGSFNYSSGPHSMSDDGRVVVWRDESETYYHHDAHTGDLRRLRTPVSIDGFRISTDADGRHLFVEGRQNWPGTGIDGYLLDAATGTPRVTVRGADDVTMGGDGTRLLVQYQNTLVVTGWDTGSAVTLDGVSTRGPLSLNSALSPNGRWLAYGSTTDPTGRPLSAVPQTWLADLLSGDRYLLTRGPDGSLATASGTIMDVDDAGRVLFNTDAALVPDDTNGVLDGYVAVRRSAPDFTAPLVEGVPARAPEPTGWYRAPVSISWRPRPDGLPAPAPVTATTDGAVQTYVSASVCSAPGRCAVGRFTLSLDQRPPTVSVGPVLPVPPEGSVPVSAIDTGSSGLAELVVTFRRAGGGTTVRRVTACAWGSHDCRGFDVAAPREPGSYVVTAAATDVAGHVSTSQRTLVVVTS